MIILFMIIIFANKFDIVFKLCMTLNIYLKNHKKTIQCLDSDSETLMEFSI